MQSKIRTVALVATNTLALPGAIFAQDPTVAADAFAYTQATHCRIVEMKFNLPPAEIIPLSLTPAGLFDPISADAASVTAALDPIAAQIGQHGTLVARAVSEGPDGRWTMINYWTDRDAMNRINDEALTWPEFAALPGVVNIETVQIQQLDIASSVGLDAG